MKTLRRAAPAVAALIVALFCGHALAQSQNDIALTRAEIQTERQAIVAENLPLEDAQAKAFWPLYRDYRAELSKVGDRFMSLVESYAKSLDTLTDAQAQSMLDEFFAIQKEELKIKSGWAPKFAKVISPKAVLRFYQIENKLDAALRFEAADVIPLVPHKAQGK